MAFVACARRDAVGIVEITNPPVNAMSPGVPRAIIEALDAFADDAAIAAIVLIGGGARNIGGADIKVQGKDWPDGEPTLRNVVAALDAMEKPAVAALGPATFGGGFEIAMGAPYRIIVTGGQIGQPEVKLGIPPGAGATQRLPRLVGMEAALEMIALGSPVRADHALAIGAVDRIAEGDLLDAAVAFASEIANERPIPTISTRPVELAKDDAVEAIRKRAARRFRGHRAPGIAIDLTVSAGTASFDEGLKAERQAFLDCVASPEAAALRHVFFAERAAMKFPGITKETTAPEIEQIAILGAGTMGTGIAIACLDAGLRTTLIDTVLESLERGVKRIADHYAGQIKKGRISQSDATDRQAALTSGTAIETVETADLIIEAVFEDLAVKRDVFAQLDDAARPDAVLATNTSYLDVNAIAEAAPTHKGAVLGLHFFSPANVMRLLEVVVARDTSAETIAATLQLAKRLRKLPIAAGVERGFIGNRMYACYRREAHFLAEEGANPQAIDQALTEFGMAMGPFAVQDLTGLDIAFKARQSEPRDPDGRYSPLLDLMVEAGRLGRKTGVGFYRYEDGKPVPDPEVNAIAEAAARQAGVTRRSISAEEIRNRCLFALVNEAARLLDEKIALRGSDVDLVWMNGYGFPDRLGGPLFWADTLGLNIVLSAIKDFDRDHDFWTPAPLLDRLVGEGGRLSAVTNDRLKR